MMNMGAWTPVEIVTLVTSLTSLAGVILAIVRAFKSAPKTLPDGTPTVQAVEDNTKSSGAHAGQIAALQTSVSALTNGPKT